ncbi:hypothetical protein F5X96DRAFT_617974 [Biscogniauxia mediterranea]|nr:hypothetical protein F5X96DRAFT_617974 [Biscogniauxia mediterranea]
MPNNTEKLACYAAIYEPIQSVGATVMSRLNVYHMLDKVPLAINSGSRWGLMASSLVFALPLMFIAPLRY